VNKKGLPVWKLAYSFSVYIILPENTLQYLSTAADIHRKLQNVVYMKKKSMFIKKKGGKT
jgi:hypothetical protein